MSMRVLRKALGLLVVDIVLIIGIFVLQFRTDSTILEKIGNLQVTMALTESQDEVSELKNKLLVTYNGVSYYCDDQNPAQITRKNSQQKTNISLIEWEKTDLSFCFKFTEGVEIVFALTSDSPEATLSASAKLPSGVTALYLPYNMAYNMKLQKTEENRLIVSGKKNAWEMQAASISKGYVTFEDDAYVATYSVHDTSRQFSFDTITDIAIANSSAFNATLNNFKNSLISTYKANNVEANITEQAVVAYVAAQAEKGNYLQAVEEISQNFKKSKNRTYLSAPYFNNLEDMNHILDQAIAENEQLITRSSNNTTLDIYTVRNLAAYMYIHPNLSAVNAVLQKAATADVSTATLAQVTGILEVYTDLYKYDRDLANVLVPVLEACIDKIESACSYDGTVLTISENDTFLSVIQAVETGIAVMRYGAVTGNQTLVKAGYVLVNSYITENSSFDLRTLSNIYPILAFDNTYYPHFQKIDTEDGRKLWAWTCAKSIKYTAEDELTINFAIDFPENYTHYLIFKGVPAFKTIYIYNMAFRTDPRFESYNSSGYVYHPETKTLLIKSRHKQRNENIKIDLYSSDYVVPVKPAPAKPEPAASETSAPKPAVPAQTPAPAPSPAKPAEPAPAPVAPAPEKAPEPAVAPTPAPAEPVTEAPSVAASEPEAAVPVPAPVNEEPAADDTAAKKKKRK